MIQRTGRRIISYPDDWMTYVALRSISTVAAGPPFSPTDVAGLEAWWDFSDISMLYQDAAKTTPVTADNDVIGAIEDKAGNGYDATQATTANKATYKTGIQNGLSVGSFSTDDYYSISVTTTNYHIFIVSVNDVQDTRGVFIGTNDYKTTTHYHNTSTGNMKHRYNNTNHESAVLDQTVFRLYEFIYDGSTIYIAIDTSKDEGTAKVAYEHTHALMGTDQSLFLTGDIGEMIFYNTEITGADLSSLHTYFDNKWSLPY